MYANEAGQLIDDGSAPPDFTASSTGTSDGGLGDLFGGFELPPEATAGDWTIPGLETPSPADTPGPDTPAPAALPPAGPTPGDFPPTPPPGWVGQWPPDTTTLGNMAAAAGQGAILGGATGAAGGPAPDGGGGGGGGGGGAITPSTQTATKFWTPTKIAVAAVLGAGGVGLIVYFATRPKRRHNPRRRRR